MGRPKKKPKKLIDAVLEELNYDELLKLGAENRNKKNDYKFQDEFKNRPEAEIQVILNNLYELLNDSMKKYLNGDAASKESWKSSSANNCEMVGKILQVGVDIAIVVSQLDFQLDCYKNIAVLLNRILPAIPDALDSLKNSMAQYCEKLYLTKFSDESEHFLFNVFPYLFLKTVGKRALKTDIKRIYAMRKKLEAVLEVLNEKGSSKILWDLFESCIISSTYALIPEGQKIIAILMTLDVIKLKEFHNIIKERISSMSMKHCKGLGKVYFEAWHIIENKGDAEYKEVIENIYGDFVKTGLNAQRNNNILPNIRKILAEFHIHKKERAVMAMLVKIFHPLIFCELKNSCGHIRSNAAQLFLDIFPFEEYGAGIVRSANELNDQLIVIEKLLEDDFPIVRVTTILGLCISISVNWEVYPPEMMQNYFKIMVNNISRDSADAEVRCALVKGMVCLLENQLSMRVLSKILPALGGMFHDVSETVRLTFCHLLLKIKNISAIKYFDIVTAGELLSRLEIDCYPVQKCITNLLHNSYFPRNEDPKVWLGRCLEIIKTHKNACRVFFTYVSCFIGIESSVRFMIQAIRALHSYVKAKTSPLEFESQMCNKENILNIDDYIANLERAAGFNDLKVVQSLLDCIVCMWLSLKKDTYKQENKHLLKMLVAKITQPLTDICNHYEKTIIWQSAIYISSFLPLLSVKTLDKLCFSKLKELPLDSKEEDYMTLLECICKRQQVPELFDVFRQWIESGLSDMYGPLPKKKRRSRRGTQEIYINQPKPQLAVEMLDFLIKHPSLNKNFIIYRKHTEKFLYFVDDIKEKLMCSNAKQISETDAAFLRSLMYVNLRLAIFLYNIEVGSSDEDVKLIVETTHWAKKNIIKYLVTSENETDYFNRLVFKICENLCEAINDVTALGYCNPNNSIYISFYDKLLSSEIGYKFINLFNSFMYKHGASALYLYLQNGNTVMLDNLFKMLCNIFDYYNKEIFLQNINKERAICLLSNVMELVHNSIHCVEESAIKVFKLFIKNILDSVATNIHNVVKELLDDPFDKIPIPEAAAFFLSVLKFKEIPILTYVRILNAMFEDSKDISLWIAHWTIIYNILDNLVKFSGKTKLVFKETKVLVDNLGTAIYEIYPRKSTAEHIETEESHQQKIFQKHCHIEYLKLKKLFREKITSYVEDKKINNKKSSNEIPEEPI